MRFSKAKKKERELAIAESSRNWQYTCQRRLRWAGHVARRVNPETCIDGKIPLESSRLRREDNIKMDLKELGYDGRDWINFVHDKNRWRASKHLRGRHFPSLEAVVKAAEALLPDMQSNNFIVYKNILQASKESENHEQTEAEDFCEYHETLASVGEWGVQSCVGGCQRQNEGGGGSSAC
ncbi:hypothetical protein ANN_05029 [Periplaneta americana]|uniref:Uncharacterized protein n=1 Tax=Periplaneta americana TaxID=6978 RepID=A0ABQ8TB86_PERAM|nr:hypothetical protein ANN_05029 [Periplaneta americana]